MTTSPSPDNIVDVAIIGGGVSGAYTAYRLMKTDPGESPVLQEILNRSGKEKLDVRLIEMSDRIGGRLWSIDVPGLPNLPAEMGGVSFSRFQCNVYGLCTQELGLETKRSRSKSHLQYFRGHHFWPGDYEPLVDPTHLRDDYYPSVVPFFLEEDEKWQYPGRLLGRLFDHVNGFNYPMALANNFMENLSLNEKYFITEINQIINGMTIVLRQAKLYDQPLYEHGFWNVIVKLLSPDACNLIQTTAALYQISNNHNLYNYSTSIMRQNIFNRSYSALTEGYDKLPKTLVNKFEQVGGTVYTQTQLLSLNSEQYNEEQLIKLTLGSSTGELRADLYARHVVLALPQRALKLLSNDSSNIFGNNQLDLLDTVTAYPAQKLILAYDNLWWEQVKRPGRLGEAAKPITDGSSITDLPVNACYYIGEENRQDGLLMALLDDTIEGFWSHLRPSAGPNSWLNPESYIDPNSKMVMEAQRQLKELHQINIPDPTAGLFWDWKDDPFGGGWHLWNPGVKSWEVASKIRQPNCNVNVFVCGEAYSEQQGWVEGALNSAEMMLEEHFELPRPNWVPNSYKFGL
ncbi:MAG: flavin monoamine oxidase family protein [Ardenticatenaceae bacterium]